MVEIQITKINPIFGGNTIQFKLLGETSTPLQAVTEAVWDESIDPNMMGCGPFSVSFHYHIDGTVIEKCKIGPVTNGLDVTDDELVITHTSNDALHEVFWFHDLPDHSRFTLTPQITYAA